ncbi:MAG: KpsF/GutQ family sugar-phosphate isomerase [Acidobacteria bacterium]|nr:MAG: KpsF/GutQ family sugar-phosphate isomerase [Acidobacteriota bacterium]
MIPASHEPMSLETARKVLEIEARTLAELPKRLDQNFVKAVETLLACRGRVVVTGMGKSGIIAQKISATLSSTGTPSFFLHPAEALHGDLGRLVSGDAVLALSYAGETEEILRLLDTIKRLAIPLVSMTGKTRSTLAQSSDVVIDASVREEACPLGLAPTASTTAMLAMGDALAMALLERRGFKEEDFAALHPAGGLAVRLRRVENVMHVGDEVPWVAPEALLPDVIYEMSKKGLGLAAVVGEDGRLAGIISDGDLRRFFQREGNQALSLPARDCMSPHPVTIGRSELATRALNLMEARRITALLVVDGSGKLEGVVHIHDLWRTEMF